MRFKKKTYPFERKEEIIKFFGDFVDYWSEDQMWTVSETIKPRGRRKDASRWQWLIKKPLQTVWKKQKNKN